MDEDRGRTLERRGNGYSRWTDSEKVSVPGLPLFVPDVLSEPETEALLLRYRIDEIGYKLSHNMLDVELRARYVTFVTCNELIVSRLGVLFAFALPTQLSPHPFPFVSSPNPILSVVFL